MFKCVLGQILFIFLVGNVSAQQHFISTDYLVISQEISDDVKFKSNATEFSYYYVSDYDIGLRLGAGKGSKASAKNEDIAYTNKIDLIYTAEIFYRLYLDSKYIDFGIGKTDYRTTWTVNNEKPIWSNNVDSDWSYHLRFGFELTDNIYVNFGYSDIYSKNKSAHTEKTKYFKAGLTYRF